MSEEIKLNEEDVTNAVATISKFDEMKLSILEMVSKYTAIKCDDIKKAEQIIEATKGKKELRKFEIDNIEKPGKGARDIFTQVNRVIMAGQKELLAITNPEVERLEAFIKEADDFKIKEERRQLLPWRKEQISKIGDKEYITKDSRFYLGDDYETELALLEMDNDKFTEYLTGRQENKIQEDKRQADLKEAEERGRKEAEEKAKADAEAEKIKAEKEKEEAITKVKQEAEDQKRKEKEDNERKEKEAKEEEEKLSKKKKYQKFLADNGYTEENKDDFIAKDLGDTVVLYKKVGEFKK